jgi:hypothetical protein
MKFNKKLFLYVLIGILIGVILSFVPLHFINYFDLLSSILSHGATFDPNFSWGFLIFFPFKVVYISVFCGLLGYLVYIVKYKNPKIAVVVISIIGIMYILFYSLYFYETIYVSNLNNDYSLKAQAESNVHFCSLMKSTYFDSRYSDEDFLSGCYSTTAIETGNVSICNFLSNDYVLYKDVCLSNVAQKINNPKICNEILSENKYICLTALASSLKNSSICLSISPDIEDKNSGIEINGIITYKKYRDICLEEVNSKIIPTLPTQ